MRRPRVTIGEAAERTGLTAKAIRLYEQHGLIAPTERTAAGYRMYGPRDLEILRFIRQAKTLGLRLDEIGRILDLQRAGAQPCATVVRLLDERIGDIDRTMAELAALRQTLVNARRGAKQASREGDDAVICRLIEGTLH